MTERERRELRERINAVKRRRLAMQQAARSAYEAQDPHTRQARTRLRMLDDGGRVT